jgi:LysM repeat protein
MAQLYGRNAARRSLLPRRTMAAVLVSTVCLVLAGCSTHQGSSRAPSTTPTAVGAGRVHVVAAGETLSIIAQQTGTPVERLAQLNDVRDANVIEVGTVLRLDEEVPVGSGRYPQPNRDVPRELWGAVSMALEGARAWRVPDLTTQLADWRAWSGENPEMALGLSIASSAAVLLAAWQLAESGARRIAHARARPAAAPTPGRVTDPLALESSASTPKLGHENQAHVTANSETTELSRPTKRPSTIAAGGRRVARSLGFAVSRTTRAFIGAASWAPRKTAAGLHEHARVRADAEARSASTERWWRRGREEMRLGLVTEAAANFTAGLHEARARGWQNEERMYIDALQELAGLHTRGNEVSPGETSGPHESAPPSRGET